MKEDVLNFFADLWKLANAKHSQGVYNTVCLVVLLALPVLVLLTSLVVCCHCCCCRKPDRSCCRGGSPSSSAARSEKKKKQGPNGDDLWISVKAGPMSPDRVALTTV